eukprot:gene57553-biopygen5768
MPHCHESPRYTKEPRTAEDIDQVIVAALPESIDRMTQDQVNGFCKTYLLDKLLGLDDMGEPCKDIAGVTGQDKCTISECGAIPDNDAGRAEIYRIYCRCVHTHMKHGCPVNGACRPKDWTERRCKKGYPRDVCEYTTIDARGYAHYRRPKDSERVVPHNPYLLTRFQCHHETALADLFFLV